MDSKHKPTTASHASCAFALTAAVAATGRVQLTPAGKFASHDGRPASIAGCPFKDWTVDAAAFKTIVANHAKSKLAELVVDYEHQTYLSNSNGKPAPAAGWFTGFDFVEGVGLFATGVTWTAAAAAAIAAGEYKYVSPVMACDAQGRVIKVLNFALTNNPALGGMAAVALSAHADLNLDPSSSTPSAKKETPKMLTLLTALGLNADTSEAVALQTLATVQAEVTALKANQFDPAKHVPMTVHAELQTQLTALSTKVESDGKAALLHAMLSDGRIEAAQQAYWATVSLTALEAFSKVATPNPAFAAAAQAAAAKGAGDKGGAGGVGAGAAITLTAEEKALALSSGLTEAEMLTSKTSLSARGALTA